MVYNEPMQMALFKSKNMKVFKDDFSHLNTTPQTKTSAAQKVNAKDLRIFQLPSPFLKNWTR